MTANRGERLPPLLGKPLDIRYLPSLTAGRGRLYSNQPCGSPVHAGTSIRDRRIVLDTSLRRRPKELARILIHEVFHFAWIRLGNGGRRSFEELIRSEFEARARGELGWSAEMRKRGLMASRSRPYSGRPWREYLCESFCDTAAWMYSGRGRHEEFTLAGRHCSRRAEWFRATFQGAGIPI